MAVKAGMNRTSKCSENPAETEKRVNGWTIVYRLSRHFMPLDAVFIVNFPIPPPAWGRNFWGLVQCRVIDLPPPELPSMSDVHHKGASGRVLSAPLHMPARWWKFRLVYVWVVWESLLLS